ncbi:MAG: tetratricopeptide repeat protein [Planctomycetota bacterium]
MVADRTKTLASARGGWLLALPVLLLWSCQIRSLQEAREAYRAGSYAQAERSYLSLLEDVPGSPLIRVELAQVYFEADSLDRAFQTLTRIGAVRDPLLIDAVAASFGRLGHRYFATGKFNAASRCFARSIALWPQNPDLFDALGRSEYRRGRPRQAISPLLSSITLAPENDGAYFYLGLIDDTAPFLDETIAEQRALHDEHPANGDLAYRLGVLYEVRWRWRGDDDDRLDALRAYEVTTALRPDFPNPWLHRYVLEGAAGESGWLRPLFERYRELRIQHGLVAPDPSVADLLLLPARARQPIVPPDDQS